MIRLPFFLKSNGTEKEIEGEVVTTFSKPVVKFHGQIRKMMQQNFP